MCLSESSRIRVSSIYKKERVKSKANPRRNRYGNKSEYKCASPQECITCIFVINPMRNIALASHFLCLLLRGGTFQSLDRARNEDETSLSRFLWPFSFSPAAS